MAFKWHTKMDGVEFATFFRTLREMNESLAKTCDDIERLLKDEQEKAPTLRSTPPATT